MNIFECIVVSLCVIVVGLWGLAYIAAKMNLLTEEEKPKKVSGQDLVKAQTKAEKVVKKSLKGKDAKDIKVEVKAGVRTKKDDMRFPELPAETKKTPAKRGRKPVKKGGHLD